jgi:hypothetical protein
VSAVPYAVKMVRVVETQDHVLQDQLNPPCQEVAVASRLDTIIFRISHFLGGGWRLCTFLHLLHVYRYSILLVYMYKYA